MSILNRIAHFQGRRDEAPNQKLARELAERGDQDGIRELAANLHHADQDVRSDRLKTLYEVGYLKAELVTEYAADLFGPRGRKEGRRSRSQGHRFARGCAAAPVSRPAAPPGAGLSPLVR